MPLLFNTALKILNSTFTSWKKERHPTLRGKRSFHFFMILYVDKSHTHIQKDKRKDSAKSCQTRDPVDCSLPGSSVHGILQARILQWVTISFSRGSSQPKNRTQFSSIHIDTHIQTHKLELNLDVQEVRENHTKIKCVSNTRNNMKIKKISFTIVLK